MNKNNDDWMHREVIDHPKFEEVFQEEYQKILEKSKKDKYDKAFQIEMAKIHDPETAAQEAQKNLEIDPGFYDNLEE